MENARLNLAGLTKFAVGKAMEHYEQKTQLPLGELVNPLVEEGLKRLGVGMMEIDPVCMALGKIVLVGMQNQKKIDEARREHDSKQQRDG